MKHNLISFIIYCVFIFLNTYTCFAENRHFGILSKSIDDINFVDTVKGCQEEALKNGDMCIHIGPEGSADGRAQIKALEKAAAEKEICAFAISVIFSEGLAKAVEKNVNVPVITFDSPFDNKYSHISKSYVGIDNFQFGRDLAKIAKKLKPGGGSVFLMGDMHDPNLFQRIHGVRFELSGKKNFSGDRPLKGEGGWKEFKRSPWRSGDNIERTMEELSYTLNFFKPDVFISVGHWPVINSKKYRKTIKPFSGALKNNETAIIIGVGKVFPEYEKLLEDGLIHGLVSIDFKRIGKITYKILKDITENKSVPKTVYIENKHIMVGR